MANRLVGGDPNLLSRLIFGQPSVDEDSQLAAIVREETARRSGAVEVAGVAVEIERLDGHRERAPAHVDADEPKQLARVVVVGGASHVGRR